MSYSTKSGSAALPLPTQSTSVTEFAGALDNVASALMETSIAQQGGAIDVWTGSAAAAYSSEANVVQSRIGDAEAALNNAATAINDYQSAYDTLVGTTIPDYQQQWDEARRVHDENVESYEEQKAAAIARAEPGVTVDTSEFDRLIQEEHETLEENQDDLARYYNQSVDEVDGIAEEKGGLVAAAIDGLVPRDIATDGGDPYTPNRNNIGVELFGDLDHIGSNARWENAQEDVEGAVELLNDTSGEGGMPSQEALEAFNEQYGDLLANDPFFAAAFADRVPPEQMFEISGAQRDYMVSLPAEYQAAYSEFQANMGAALMLATGSEPAGGSNTAWDVWQGGRDALVFSGNTGYEEWAPQYLGDIGEAAQGNYGYNGTSGYYYLTQMLGATGDHYENLALSDGFLNDGGTNSLGHQIVQWRHESPFQFEMMSGASPTDFRDPLYNMFKVMDGNPDATRTFLGSETGFDYGNDNTNMTAYLVGHVTDMDQAPWPDQGTQLGTIIDEATSTPDARQHPETFEILNGFLDGYNDGLQRDQTPGLLGGDDKVSDWNFLSNKEGEGQDYFGRNNAGLRHMAGSILEEYTSDLAREISLPSGVAGAPPYMQSLDGSGYTLALSPELHNALTDSENGFFFDLSYDTPAHPGSDASAEELQAWSEQVADSALGKISTSAAAGMRTEMIQAEIEGNGAYYNDVAGDYGTLLTHLELADYNADVAQGAAADARNSTVRSSIDFVTDFLPVSKIPGWDELPDYVQTAIEKGQEGATETSYDAFLSTNNEENAQDARGVGLENIERQLRDMSNANGIIAGNEALENALTPEELAALEQQREEVRSNQIFVNPDGTITQWGQMTPEEQQAYNLWVNDYRLGDGDNTADFNNDIADIVDNAYNDSVNYNP
ncbi:hypothetical protein [Flaviflexus massiliensis]|uniref:hypothetical protein n=1 Tax=Flaviflexus massiliensis TaxID=1522309 RepID=UPI0006D57D79|nr:hypothetical protein [Flaviflexus massiliensis]